MADKLVNTQAESYIQEDEIDLKELFLTIRKHILKIILFVIVITSATFIYVLSLPNMYKSQVVLSPQGGSSGAIGGNLASLASLAGVNIGASKDSGADPFLMMDTTLKDYEFNKYMIEKYKLDQKLENPKNLVFALGIDSVYNFFKSEKEEKTKDEIIFQTKNALSKILSLSSDKKTGLITLNATHEDRYLAHELVNIYLKEIIEHVKQKDKKDLDNQIQFYKTELAQAKDVALKEQLSKSLSGLLQKRVFSKANEYYFVSKLTDSRVAYIKEKTKPKRGLILVVSFVTSFILGIFAVFLYEFIRNEKK